MTREVKFRAWDKKDRVIRDVLGISFYHDSVSVDIGHGRYLQDDVGRFKLMQYTGLVDKNGTEIYEGDKLWDEYYEEYYVVLLKEGAFLVENETLSNLLSEVHGDCEVIGNIHEHEHLLGGVDK